jgi:ADP-heptose:LPS heptosyltransferase
MAAWAATAIRREHPEAFLGWAVESRCSPVIDRSELCSRVCEFPRDRWKKHRWSPGTWREQLASYARLRQLRFDYGIDLQGHSKTALCLRIANPEKRIAARATDSLAARLNPVHGIPRPGTHTVEWNQEVLSTLGYFEFPLRPTMAPAGEVQPRLITISVSAGQPNKAYPLENWAAVAAHLRDAGYDVRFLGGPTDSKIAVEGTTDLVGELPLGKSMALVGQSRLHLAGDTGTGHMAAAYGVPVVSVFGPTDPAVFRPFTDRGTVLKQSERTADVSPQMVIEAAEAMLAISH